ncbi:hypothetical protein HK102_009705 [Quaeritorhiza haematococci]|nr:hypothetical protein HK102_009705 [Quaeritorhiza haematococci]
MFLRPFARAASVAASTVKPTASVAKLAAVRAFTTQTPVVRADIITNLYLAELKKYTPPTQTEKADLPETFKAPSPPPKPAVEAPVEAVAETTLEAAVEEEEWPPLYNPIDDPQYYNDAWDFSTDHDDGALYPKRLKPVDYHHGH